jgi:hypothetical protein
MRTRTLMLWSVILGLAILLAGGVLLIQILNRTEVVEPTAVGTAVQVGDMTVVVESSEQRNGRYEVEVIIGGIDDLNGTDGFRMIASARPAPLLESCGATSEQPAPCTLVFEAPDDGGSRQLLYERGDQSARWVLALPNS